MKKSLTNTEIVTLAVYLLGGENKSVDTEDIAIKSNELAPNRFTWRKYPEQVNIGNVHRRLSFAKDRLGYILGSHREGWLLTRKGLNYSRKQEKKLGDIPNLLFTGMNKESSWYDREKIRMLASDAYLKLNSNNMEPVTLKEAEAFFRLDDYIIGASRENKIIRIIKHFGNDPDLQHTIRLLERKVRKNA